MMSLFLLFALLGLQQPSLGGIPASAAARTAPAFVTATDSGSNGCGTQTTCNISFTPTNSGDFLLICALQFGNTTVTGVADTNGTPIAAFAQVKNGTATTATCYSEKNAASGAHSITATFGGANWTDMFVSEYSGASTTTPLDGAGCSATGTAVTPPSCTLTTGNTNETAVGWVVISNTTAAAGSGFTSRNTIDHTQVEDITVAVAGTQDVNTVTASGGNAWTVMAVALTQ